MPNTRIRDAWEPMVKQIIADMGPRTGPTRIRKRLIQWADEMRKRGDHVSTDYPSERTIQRIKEDLTDDELQEYRRFTWPKSMEYALPWEASNAALELLAYLHVLGAGRPSIRIVRWFWRVSQALPNARLDQRLALTLDIVTHQLQGREIPVGLEWWMAFSATGKALANGSHEAAVLDPIRPIPDYIPVLNLPPQNTQGIEDSSLMEDYSLTLAAVFGFMGIRHYEEATNGDAQG
jgi:hypothetical protein